MSGDVRDRGCVYIPSWERNKGGGGFLDNVCLGFTLSRSGIRLQLLWKNNSVSEHN